MSDEPSQPRTDAFSRREVLSAVSGFPAVPFLRSTPKAPSDSVTDLMAPNTLPSVQGYAVRATGEITSKSLQPRTISPVAAYECPYCGASRVPTGLDEEALPPERPCPLCAIKESTSLDHRRHVLSYYEMSVDFPDDGQLQTSDVFIPSSLVDDWERFSLGGKVCVSGTIRQLAPIVRDTSRRTESGPPWFDYLDCVARLDEGVWSESTAQVLAGSVTLLSEAGNRV